jgi:hypothetical protein
MFWCVSRWKAVAGGVNDSILQGYPCVAYLRVRPAYRVFGITLQNAGNVFIMA